MSRVRNETESGLAEVAKKVLPAGGFGNISTDLILREGRAAHVWDVSGNEYVDFLLGSGPMFIGHSHPEVVAAVQDQLARGTTFFTNNEAGIRLAEAICEAVPCAEKLRYTSSGSEATHYAMRIARAYRGRDKIMKFEGGFHGMGDYALMSMAPKTPGNFPQATPDTAGIPDVLRGEMVIAPFNDIETALSLIHEHRQELAAIIVEPFQRLIPPKPGFLQALRAAATEHDIPLIFDEIVTGFRFAYGGAQAYYGVTPDLCALGKIIGGGFPLAAVVGRDDLMKHFDKSRVAEDRFTPQVGTLSGNPIAAVAGLATLEVLRRPGAYEKVHNTGRALMAGVTRLLADAGLDAQVVGEPPLFEVFFTDREIWNYRDVQRADAGRLRQLNGLLLERGVLKGDTKYYISVAHTKEDVETTMAAWGDAFQVMRRHKLAS